MDRREFLRRSAILGAGAAAAGAALGKAAPAMAAPAHAADVPYHVDEDDPSVSHAMVSFKSTDGATIQAYTAWPSQVFGPLPVVAICHENQGLNSHFPDVARRFAQQGYLAIAPDLL